MKSQHFPLSRAAGAWEGGPCARARLERRSGALGALGLPRGQPLSAFHLKLLRESARITCFLEHSRRSCALYGPCRLEDHPAAQTWGARGLSGLCLPERHLEGGARGECPQSALVGSRSEQVARVQFPTRRQNEMPSNPADMTEVTLSVYSVCKHKCNRKSAVGGAGLPPALQLPGPAGPCPLPSPRALARRFAE